MKIHNYGNDYAYQQKQKSKEMAQAKNNAPVIEPEKEEVKNAGNQVHEGGKEEVAQKETEGQEVLGESKGTESEELAKEVREAQTEGTQAANQRKKKQTH